MLPQAVRLRTQAGSFAATILNSSSPARINLSQNIIAALIAEQQFEGNVYFWQHEVHGYKYTGMSGKGKSP